MSASATSSPESRSILLVEDEPTLQRILGSVLGDAGHRVEAVGTAEQALERFDDGAEIDLVVTDKNLPRRSGLDLLAELRLLERRRQRPIGVVLVTGYPGRDSAARALDDDVDGYLVKPFRSLSHAVDDVQRVLATDLVARRAGTALARRLATALIGSDDVGDAGLVAVLGLDHVAARLRALGVEVGSV
ncbi:MAG TPA: response regulator, partial [Myxococcota bacterium]